ncbi:SDR family oxidoreductase [Nocardiopsis sp. NPDC101807]|uniref:SDR family oxidoreductase n=1 Tax=Nocardiopsis sp. NPDC101807 TaxID=3364339 RepID=UPI0038210739
MKTVLVTGGTGTLGRPVVEHLRRAGHGVRPLSRRPDPADPDAVGVDLRTGSGLGRALEGVDTVVHCATNPAGGDVEAATHLIREVRAAGTAHVVYVSIVGVDRVPLGYYRDKLLVERALEGSGLGWTVLRATQFHTLVRRICAGAARSPLMPFPDVEAQPVDSAEVASRLARLAEGDPAGRAPDMGGPRVESFRGLVRAYLEAEGLRRRPVPVRLPGRTFAAYRAGGHLAPDRAVGRTTFAEYLAR